MNLEGLTGGGNTHELAGVNAAELDHHGVVLTVRACHNFLGLPRGIGERLVHVFRGCQVPFGAAANAFARLMIDEVGVNVLAGGFDIHVRENLSHAEGDGAQVFGHLRHHVFDNISPLTHGFSFRWVTCRSRGLNCFLCR